MSDFVTYKNIPVHYTDQGKGSVIVLIHGFLENLNMWKNLIPHIEKRNRVICIDLLGHGKSKNLGYIHTMEEMAEIVKAVLRKLQIRRIVIVGHSMGGYVCLAFAEKYPEMIKGLCLMNSTSLADSDEKKKNRDRAVLAVKENHKTFIRVSIPNLFSISNQNKMISEIKSVIDDALQMTVQGIIASLEGMKIRKNRSELLKAGSYKKLIILGKADTILNNKTLKKEMKGSGVQIIEFSGGHMSHFENIEEFTYNILHFIEK